MELFRFGNRELLNLFYFIPVLIGMFLLAYYSRKRMLKKYGDLHLIKILSPDYSHIRKVLKLTILIAGISFLIIAIAQPQFGSKLEEVKSNGIELVIALDVSNSMLAEDISPNRLERAKMEISKLIDNLKGDKISIIVFAGDAYTQLPMTTDYGAVKLFLKTINPGIVPKQGTAIGSAIDLGINSFTPDSESGKAIIIITDGENHEDNAVASAQLAAEKGIIVHTLGMGTLKGAPIPLKSGFQSKTYRKDREGNVIITQLNDKIMNEIAIAGGGEFHLASNASIGLKEILKKIQSMNKSTFEIQKFSEFDEVFQYFIAIALLFLIIETIILGRKNRFTKNINLIEIKKK